MLRCSIACFLIFALIASNFSSLFIYAGFKLNHNYIAAKLCENKDKPWLHCNGKCYFINKIKQARDKQKSDERQSQKNNFQEALFTQKPVICFYSDVLQIMLVPNNRIILPLAYFPIIQPPQLGKFS